MTKYKKSAFPVSKVRKFLEPGPIVLVSSQSNDQINVMTMGWYTVMEFTPSLIGCMIASSDQSFKMIQQSRECVINLPTVELLDIVVKIGNTTGAQINKFEKYSLTPEKAKRVRAPLIQECYANFECKLYDDAMVDKYNFFIFKVVYAHVAKSPKHPQTVHYTGNGVFMISGKMMSRRSLFKPEYLEE